MIYKNAIKNNTEQFKKAVPLNQLKKKLSLMNEDEAKKVKAIATTAANFLKNKDFEGAKRYLSHVKGKL